MKLDHFTQEDLNDLVLDVNGLTSRDWEELRTLALSFMAHGLFNGDSFKCSIAAAGHFLTQGKGLRDQDLSTDEWVQ